MPAKPITTTGARRASNTRSDIGPSTKPPRMPNTAMPQAVNW